MMTTTTEPPVIAELTARLGRQAVLTDSVAVEACRHDYWVVAYLRRRLGRLGPPPACVVRPATTTDVIAVLEVARKHLSPVVPFGAGSGVCGGVLAPENSIILDLSRLNRMGTLDEKNLTVTVQAGMRGDAFEAALGRRGYSMGHFPQSIALSTVGGWVATRASGQFSTRYGSIEDMLIGFEAVLASGRVVRLKPAPRRSTGPDLCGLFCGSEGTLGVLTELTFRIHPNPAHRGLASYVFPDMSAGLEATRLIMRAGWRPAVLRLYDGIETARHFPQHTAGGCALLVLSEGPESAVVTETAAVDAIAANAGGTANGDGPVNVWLAERNTVPSWDELLDQGLLADTTEVAVDWNAATQVYREVTASIRAVPGVVMASAHSSHSYAQGTCLYVTMVIGPSDLAAGETIYEQCWDAAMRATLSAGGSISHHHGIGRVRRRWLAEELGSAYGVLTALKRSLDPDGILNPGVLLAE